MKYCPNTHCPSLCDVGFAPEYDNACTVCPICKVTLESVGLEVVMPTKEPRALSNEARVAVLSNIATAPVATASTYGIQATSGNADLPLLAAQYWQENSSTILIVIGLMGMLATLALYLLPA